VRRSRDPHPYAIDQAATPKPGRAWADLTSKRFGLAVVAFGKGHAYRKEGGRRSEEYFSHALILSA
jgi:hypothetical protein